MENKRIDTITINYTNEAPIADKLTVMRGERDGLWCFRTLRSDGKVNTEAEIHLTDIK